jgi:ABC-type maltose transport system permease subunit
VYGLSSEHLSKRCLVPIVVVIVGTFMIFDIHFMQGTIDKGHLQIRQDGLVPNSYTFTMYDNSLSQYFIHTLFSHQYNPSLTIRKYNFSTSLHVSAVNGHHQVSCYAKIVALYKI